MNTHAFFHTPARADDATLHGPQDTPRNTTPGATLDAPEAPLWLPLELLLQEDDQAFSEQLPSLVQHNHLSPHDDQLWHPQVLARLCSLSDPLFTATILDLAKPDCLGLDILFDERLLPRLAAMRRGHLRGTFLPYARRLKGFDARDFLRDLHRIQQAQRAAGGRPVVVPMHTVTATPVTWLWWPYIALGKVCMLDGDPGIGKSLLMTQLAASLSKGHPLPDQEGRPTFPTGGSHVTVMLSTEDGLADTLKPRLEAAGADCAQIRVLTGWQDADGELHAFSFQDMPMLERVLEEHDPRLVVIDPVQAYLGSGVDMHRANETRPLLEKLRALAEAHHCAIVCVRHPAKSSQGGKAMHRGLGSVDFIGAARTGLFVEQHPLDPTVALVAQSKSNIGPLGRTLLFSKQQGQFEWAGRSRLSVEMLAGSGRGLDPHAFFEAVCWLEDRLQEGLPEESSLIAEEAEEEGISFATLRRAKKALGVKSIRRSLERTDGWDWQLPALATIPQPNPLLSLASPGSLGLVQGNQPVSLTPCENLGLPPAPEVIEGPVGCGCGQGQPHPADACTPEVVEKKEEVLESQPEEGAEDPVPPRPQTPTRCPTCRKPTTWTLRGGIPFCSKCRQPAWVKR